MFTVASSEGQPKGISAARAASRVQNSSKIDRST
jgi:hypothetical protein